MVFKVVKIATCLKMKKSETGNASKCAKKSSKRNYTRKRKFKGNQYTDKHNIINAEQGTTKTRRQSVVTEEDKMSSASSKKVKEVTATKSDGLEGFRLVDMSILRNIIGLFSCPECEEDGCVYIGRKGLASCLQIECTNCSFSYTTYTSKRVGNNEKAMEVNIRSVYAMRRCGVGHKGLQKFCGVMNMPPPVARKNYDKLSDKVGVAVEKVAKTAMIQAALEVKECDGDNIGVSFDGSWQKRGYSSLNGVGTAISINTGKVLDCEILSRHCKSCVLHTPLKDTNPTE